MKDKEKDIYLKKIIEAKKSLIKDLTENDVLVRLKTAAQQRDTGIMQIQQLQRAVEQARGEVSVCVQVLVSAEERRRGEKPTDPAEPKLIKSKPKKKKKKRKK